MFNNVSITPSQQSIIDEYLLNGYRVFNRPVGAGQAIKVLINSYDETIELILGKNGKVYNKTILKGSV